MKRPGGSGLEGNGARANGRPADSDPPDEPQRWRALYGLVIGELAVLVLLFYWLTRWAS